MISVTKSIIFRQQYNFGIFSEKKMSTAKRIICFFLGHNLPKPKLASRNQKYFVSKRQRVNNRTIGLIKVMQRFLVRVLNIRKNMHLEALTSCENSIIFEIRTTVGKSIVPAPNRKIPRIQKRTLIQFWYDVCF